MSNNIINNPNPKLFIPDTRIDSIVENRIFGLPDEFDVADAQNMLLDAKPQDLFTEPEDFIRELMFMLTDPDNFGLFCKLILNIDLHPFQFCMQNELWKRKFPMLIATRGGGKCISGDTFLHTSVGICRMRDIFDDDEYILNKKLNVNCSIVGESGFLLPQYKWIKGFDKTIKIRTNFGYEIECSTEHPLRVVQDNNIVWKKACDILSTDILIIDRNIQQYWHNNDDDALDEDISYMFGCLVGDGGYTKNDTITITSQDQEIIDKCNIAAKNIWGKIFNKEKKTITYNLCGIKIRESLFSIYGFNSSVCAEKDFPKSILKSSKKNIAAFVRGLMDTDGHMPTNRLRISISSKSQNLIKTLQFILSRFGIISKTKQRFNKKYSRYYYYLYIYGENCKIFNEYIGFGLKSKHDKLQSLLNIKCNTNVDVVPRELILNDLLKLRDIFYKYYEFGGNGYSYNRELISKWRLQKYNISYSTLYKILMLYEQYDKCVESIYYQHLLDIYNKRYFYDRIQSLENKDNFLYDLYIDKDHSYISNGFISHNSWCLALYAIRRALIKQGSRIIITGSGFRQSKIVFEYMEKIWQNSPILQNLTGKSLRQGPKRNPDSYNFYIGESEVLAIPIGMGDKIRGLRANVILADEFAKIPREIFEVVIKGFAATSANPVDRIKDIKRIEVLQSLGMFAEAEEESQNLDFGNQIVISGTADYAFNHFYDYWKRYKDIIQSGGDITRLQEIFYGEIPSGFDWTQYSIFRVPWMCLPKGFLDETQIAQAKATIHIALYRMEYACIWLADSDGFFKRSLIEGCVTNKPISLPSGPVQFAANIYGNPDKKYVYGIDPASEVDNFAIVILEVNGDHRRIVYCWTANRLQELKNKTGGKKTHRSFYAYCARKIRELMKVFPTEHIGIDGQGGGIVIAEALHDPQELEHGEYMMWPYIVNTQGGDPFWWEQEKKPTDDEPGLHILHVVQFAKSDFTNEANHGLRKDFETKSLLFPYFDPVAISTAIVQDQLMGQDDNNLEDCMREIEELKDELATIQHTQSPNGRDRWDTPEIIKPGGKKGRLRKDRYSALLIANMVARTLEQEKPMVDYKFAGGFVGQKVEQKKPLNVGDMYIGPHNIVSGLNHSYYGSVRR